MVETTKGIIKSDRSDVIMSEKDVFENVLDKYDRIYRDWKRFIISEQQHGYLSSYDMEKINECYCEILAKLSYVILDYLGKGA